MFIRDRKLRISVFAAILFFIISNPEMFKFVRQLLGSWVSNESGCPTTQGLLLHTGVYLLITYALMNDGRELLEGQEGAEAEGAETEGAETEGAEGAETEGAEAEGAEAEGAETEGAEGAEAEGAGALPAPKELQMETAPASGDDIVGANVSDSSQFETAESITKEIDQQQNKPPQSQAELTRMLSGTSWNKCSCQDGGEVLLLR